MLECLCMLLFGCDRIFGVRSVLLRVTRVCTSSARQVTLWSYPLLPSFYALVSTLKHCMSRIDNMWVWEVVDDGRTYCPFYSNPGSYFYVMLILLRYARRRGLVWVIHDRCERLLWTKGLFKVATLIHIWVECLWAPGGSSVVQGDPGESVWSSYGLPPRLKGVIKLFMLETSVCSHKPLWALA